MNKGIVGIIVVAVIIIVLVSYFLDNQNNDESLSEIDVPAESIPKTGTNYSVDLSESIAMRNVP